MKTLLKLSLCMLCTLIVTTIQGQGTEETLTGFPTITIDLDDLSKITIPKKIEDKHFYQVKIKGINLNNYKVVIDSKDTVYSKELNFPTIGSVDLSSISAFTSTFASAASSISAVNDDGEVFKVEEAKEDALITLDVSGIEGFINTKALDFNLFSEQKMNDQFIMSLKGVDDKTKEDRIKKEIEDELAATAILIKDYEKVLKELNARIEVIEIDLMRYRVLSRTSHISSITKEEASANLILLLDLYKNAKTLHSRSKASVDKLNKFLGKVDVKFYLENEKPPKLKDKMDKAQQALSGVNSKAGKLMNNLKPERIEKLLLSILYIKKETSFTSLPIQFNGEEAEVNIKLLPKDSTSEVQARYLAPIKFPKKRSYWSVGLSSYYSILEDQRVSTETIQVNDSTKRYILREDSKFDGEIGVAALLRGGHRFKNTPIGLHFTAGTGLSIGKDVKPRFLAGGGISIGDLHSFVLDYGMIIGHVDKISKNVSLGEQLDAEPQAIIRQLDWKYFVSIGYAYRF